MEETIKLVEGTEEHPVLIITTPITKEVPLDVLKRQRDTLAIQRDSMNDRVEKLDATISKAEKVIDKG